MDSTINKDLNNLNLNNPKELMDSTGVPYINTALKQISTQTPVEDYEHNMLAEMAYEYADDDEYDKYGCWNTFAQARRIVWQLLFDEATLSTENFNKASELLEYQRRDALMLSPRDYNLWIPKMRDEHLKRNYFDFWQDVIVKKELGLCCGHDGKFADDMLDGKDTDEFYKVGQDFIQKLTN